MRARTEIARPRDRHRIVLGDARARSLRQQIDHVGQADRLLEVVGDQQHADAFAFDQLDHVLDDAGAHDGVERGERLVHQQELRFHRQHLRERDALALPAAEVARKAIAETGEAEPPEPLVGLRPAPRRAPRREVETERDVVTRGLPRQQRVVLEQHADLGARTPVSIVPASGCCRPMTARSRLDLPEPEGPTRLTNWPGRRRGSPLRAPARRRRRSSGRRRAAVSLPTIVVSCSPDMLASGLSRPPTREALRDALGGVEIDGDGVGIERRRDSGAMISPNSLRSSPVVISLGSAATICSPVIVCSACERVGERLGQRDHLGPALLDLLGAHRHAHELVGAAEIFLARPPGPCR